MWMMIWFVGTGQVTCGQVGGEEKGRRKSFLLLVYINITSGALFIGYRIGDLVINSKS